MFFLFFLLLRLVDRSLAQYDSKNIPQITGVSAMCSSDGITASIDFDRAFNGKIYSMDYATVHDCLYYNTLDQDTVLFSIPAHRCGTKLSRTTRNIVDQMVNRVYVQMDKDMQSASDKQFSFICQLAEGRAKGEKGNSTSVRRHPVENSYAVAPKPVNSIQHSPPIKPDEVRVSAVSSDSRFGNWPIPGSKPYNPSMKPAAVFPPQPLPGPVNAQKVHHSNAIQPATESVYVNHLQMNPKSNESETEKNTVTTNSLDSYPSASNMPPDTRPIVPNVHRAAPLPTLAPFKIPAPPPATPLHNPISSVDSYIQHNSLKAHDSHDKTENHISPIKPLRPPPLPHTFPGSQNQAPPIHNQAPPLAQSDGYARAPAAPIQPFHIHMNQGMGMGIQSVIKPEPTKVPAQTWNVAVTSVPSTNHSKEATVTKATVHGTVFREEPKRIGIEFTKDIDENTINVEEHSTSPDNLISTQEQYAPEGQVLLEIQKGNGPFSEPVSRPVKIGENITLVVRSDTKMKDDSSFDMFVHSCFATDGPGATKIDLIDKDGCVLRPEFVSPLNRTRRDSEQIYFFRIAAFKFPGPDDVYFSCSIDVTPLREAPEICPSSSNRTKRAIVGEAMRLFDIVRVELAEDYEKEQRIEADEHLYCASPSLVASVVAIILSLLVAFAIASIAAISLHFRLSSLRLKY